MPVDDGDVALVNVHKTEEILAGSPEHLYVPGAKASDMIVADDAFPLLRLNPSHWHGWWSRSPEIIVSRFSFRKGHRWLLAPKLLWGFEAFQTEIDKAVKKMETAPRNY